MATPRAASTDRNPTPAQAADIACAEAVRLRLLAALDEVSGALRALSPSNSNRFPDTGDLLLAKGRAEAASYNLGYCVGQIDIHTRRRA